MQENEEINSKPPNPNSNLYINQTPNTQTIHSLLINITQPNAKTLEKTGPNPNQIKPNQKEIPKTQTLCLSTTKRPNQALKTMY